jgi:DNA-directed RNA polymerase specialized sigma24 family protein
MEYQVTTSVTIRLKGLTDRQATMLLQYTLLEMKQVDIAEYHGVEQNTVSEIIRQAKEKARKI